MCMNCRHFFLLTLLLTGIAVRLDAFAQGVVVYKHVDESGRVTYSNQPMKGGVVVELSPLMVLPKAQTSTGARTARPPADAGISAGPAKEPLQQAQSTASTDTASDDDSRTGDQPAATQSRAQAVRSIPQVAVVTSRSPQLDPTPRSASPSGASISAAAMAKQRRADVRRRILEGEIEAESQLLLEAQAHLRREQTKSSAMRSLRSAILDDERVTAGMKPQNEDAARTKSVVERHFEQVRELQDHVAMHEENLAELRSQLRGQTDNQTIRSAQLRPVAATKPPQAARAKP